MRVLYIAQNYFPRNAASITTHEILRKMAEKGHKTTLLAPRRCPKECEPACGFQCENNHEVKVERIPTLVPYYLVNKRRSIRALMLAFSQIFLVLKAFEICRKEKFDVVISQHHPSHLASFSSFLVSRAFRLPLIVKTHDVYSSSFSIFQSVPLRVLDAVHRMVFRHAKFILVVSSSLRSKMIETYGLKKEKVLVFPNGVDTRKFRPNINFGYLPRSLKIEGKKILLFVGQIRMERGLALLVRAMPRIVSENSDVMVLFIGGGPQKPEVEALVVESGLGEYVKFVESVDHDEMAKYICMSDIAIGPLMANIDTFGSVPRKVLEYMACAKPVVVFEGGVSRDLILDGYNGFLVYSEQEEELASSILKIINSPDIGEKVALNARKHVEKFYDWDEIMKGFEEALNAVSTKN